mgnify:FL=1
MKRCPRCKGRLLKPTAFVSGYGECCALCVRDQFDPFTGKPKRKP